MAEETRYIAEILDPLPEEVVKDLVSRTWVLERGDDTEGAAIKWRMSNTDEDVEGQGFSVRGLRPADGSENDAEGQGRTSFRGLGQTEDDVEGQGIRFGGFRPIEGEDHDVVGMSFRIKLADTGEDVEGQIRIRMRPEGDVGADDVEGHRIRLPGLSDTDDDTEGQRTRLPWGLSNTHDDTEGHIVVTFRELPRS